MKSKFCVSFLLIMVVNFVYSQNYKILSKWDKIAIRIDNKCREIDSMKIGESIAEGDKVETYILRNEVKSKLLRVRRYVSDTLYTARTYYYENNALIKFSIENSNSKKTSISYYYFFDGKCIKVIGKKWNVAEIEAILTGSKLYIQEWMNNLNR